MQWVASTLQAISEHVVSSITIADAHTSAPSSRLNWRPYWFKCSGYSVPFTLPRNMVYPTLLPLMRTPRLPAVDWTDAPRRAKWTRPFRRKTKSNFEACAIIFQLASIASIIGSTFHYILSICDILTLAFTHITMLQDWKSPQRRFKRQSAQTKQF